MTAGGGVGELLLVAVLTVTWWIPTFVALTDLHNRKGVRRVAVWRWTAVLCIPVVGALLYLRRGRHQLS